MGWESFQGKVSGMRKMRISTRIYASVATLLVLFLLSVTIACVGLWLLNTNVGRFAEADRLATVIDRIDRDIIELQRDVLVFAASGNQSAPDRVQRVGEKLRSQIKLAKSFSHDEDTAYRLDEMQVRLDAYLANFPTVVEERNTRQSLVSVDLRDFEARTRSSFQKLRELAVAGRTADLDARDDRGATEQVLLIEQSMSSVALAQLKALRFFDDPDVANVRDALDLLGDASAQLGSIADKNDTAVSIQASRVIELLSQYESAFLRAVQATRGYLSLVNVVMAGEAAEFLYQSRQIQETTSMQAERISVATLDTARRSTFGTILFAVSAIIASALVTAIVIRGIVRPIAAMTSTFAQLMQGNNDATIPGLDRSDEIGDMARAADMFRDRNRQTEQLLSQSRALAEELDEKAKELSRSNDDLNSFAYVASHDLRSPLRAIDNISAWIAEDIGVEIPSESREHLAELRRRVKRMEQLLSELLEYSRVGRGEMKLMETDVRLLLDDAVALIDLPEDATVKIDVDLPLLMTDRGSLNRVVLNLLSNAVKYRRKEPLLIECECKMVEGVPTFRISDNGIGIARKFQTRVFEMFKRLHSQSEIEGSGMGLALVMKLVEQCGGNIRLESVENQGSSFEFTWPAKSAEPAENESPSAMA